MMTRVISIVACVVFAVIMVSGCGDEMTQPPAQTEDVTDVRMGQPQFHTIYWPPPYYPGSVMKIDHRTGEGTHVVSLDVPLSPPDWPGEYPGFATPYGLGYDTDGTVYSIHNWFAGVEELSFSQVVRMDLVTGEVFPIGPVHDQNFNGPEFDECGNMYATGFGVGAPEGGPHIVFGDGFLYRFDKNTGEKTQIGDTGHTEWMDLDFDPEGNLWGTFSNDLYIIDTETGASQFITHVDGVEDNRIPGVCEEDWEWMEIMGIAFDHRGVLYATAMRGFSSCGEGGLAVPVMTVDIDNGVANLIGSSILDGQSHGGDIAPRKVIVCHRVGNGNYTPIEVSLDALPGHLDHGDVLPGGPEGFDCGCGD